jgi:hypothetical protein
MKNKENIISELKAEILELKAGSQNQPAMNRIKDLDEQINELEGNDSFRSHELQDNTLFINEVSGSVDVGEGFGDQDQGYVSESYHDPNLDY